MKKSTIIVLTLITISSLVYAEVGPADEDYDEWQTTRDKLIRMKKEMDRFMKDIVSTYPNDDKNLSVSGIESDMKVDVSETEKDIVVRADLPGIDKDKINVSLESNKTLKISAEREVMKKEILPGVIRQERSQSRFQRVLELPSEATGEGINAKYKDCVLEIVMPKKEKVKKEAVKVKVL